MMATENKKVSYPKVRVKKIHAGGKAKLLVQAQYEAAKNGRRAALWNSAADVGPETVGRQNFSIIRKRSRSEVRNHSIAARQVSIIVSETIGSGLRPHITDDDKLQRLWETFVQECDADGIQNFYGQQALAMRDLVIAGEAFARFRPRLIEDGLAVPLQIQLLSSEFLPYDSPAIPDARSGIVFGNIGERREYLFYPEHPHESDSIVNRADLVPVPAASVAHIFDQREIGQIRGEPWLTRALILLADLDAYTDAEMIRKKMAAMIAFFVESPPGDQVEVFEQTDENGNVVTVDANGNPVDDQYEILPEVEPGATVPLPPGTKVTSPSPADVGGSFDAFIRQIMRQICAATDTPYELVTGDWAGVNDRLARVMLLKFYGKVRQWRQLMIRQFCRPAWIRFLIAAEESGAWQPADGRARSDYFNIEWIGDAFPHVHPVQDVQADALAVQSGFKTKSQVIRERGGSPEIIRKERAAELELDRAAGVSSSTDVAPIEKPEENDDDAV